MAKKPLTLSLVIPVYNEENYLAICLDSVEAQLDMPDEVIVVDNNSTDATAAIAAGYSFVRLVKETRQGVVHARNKGFDCASGDIIGRIDADSILPVTWVRDVKKVFKDNSDVAFTGAGEFYDMPFKRALSVAHQYYYYYLNRIITGHYLLWGSNMAFQRKYWRVVRREILTSEAVAEDMDVSLILSKHCQVMFMPEIMNYNSFRGGKQSMVASWKYFRRWPASLRRHSRRSTYCAWIIILSVALVFGPIALLIHSFESLKLKLKVLKSYLIVDTETY